jgi:hypothetical protein
MPDQDFVKCLTNRAKEVMRTAVACSSATESIRAGSRTPALTLSGLVRCRQVFARVGLGGNHPVGVHDLPPVTVGQGMRNHIDALPCWRWLLAISLREAKSDSGQTLAVSLPVDGIWLETDPTRLSRKDCLT